MMTEGGPSSAVTRKPSLSKSWACGRVLTDQQRERKRKADRLGSKRRRQQNENKIRLLEAKVESLSRAPGDQSLFEMQNRINRLLSENESLRQSLGRRGSITIDTPASKLLNDENSARQGGSGVQEPFLNFQPTHNTKDHYDASGNNLLDFFTDSVSGIQPLPRIDPWSSNSGVQNGLLATLEETTTTLQVQIRENREEQRGNRNVTVTGSGILRIVRTLRPKDTCLNDVANQNFLILAVLEGWDVAARHLTFCPLWEALHKIHNLIFDCCSPIEKIVMLRMIHLMLMCMVDTEALKRIPTWYRPRPSQQRFPHEVIVDYFAWPGLRERLVLSEDDILTNEFWRLFASRFSFHWPYPMDAAFEKCGWTGHYRFSGLFLNHIQEIRCWQMDQEFFSKFPALIDDMNPMGSFPLSIWPTYNTQEMLALTSSESDADDS